MNLNKISQFPENLKQKTSNNLPFIKKVPTVRKLLHYSNSYLTPFPSENQYKNYPKNTRIISYGSYGINIHTKLYRINDYLSRTNKEINPFRTTFNFMNRRNLNENMEIKRKDSFDKFKADTGLTYTGFYKNKKSGESIINSARVTNNVLNLSLPKKNNNKNKLIKSESVGALDEKVDNINIDNNNNEYVIKKLNN